MVGDIALRVQERPLPFRAGHGALNGFVGIEAELGHAVIAGLTTHLLRGAVHGVLAQPRNAFGVRDVPGPVPLLENALGDNVLEVPHRNKFQHEGFSAGCCSNVSSKRGSKMGEYESWEVE